MNIKLNQTRNINVQSKTDMKLVLIISLSYIRYNTETKRITEKTKTEKNIDQ